MASDILVVDDEHDIREIVAGILSDEGHETRMAHDSDSALAAISDRVPRLVFLDIWMQGSKLDGLSLLDEIKARHPELPHRAYLPLTASADARIGAATTRAATQGRPYDAASVIANHGVLPRMNR